MSHSRLVRFVAAAELPLIIAIAPLLLFPTPGRLTALAAVPVIWLSAKTTSGRFIPHTPVNSALWLLLAMVGISLGATSSVQGSLGKVSGVVLGALLFWAITRWMTMPWRLKAGTAVFLIAGACLAVIGLLAAPDNFSMASWPWLRRLVLRLGGAEVHPNPVAGCLTLFVPLQIALLAAGSHRWMRPRPSSDSAGVSLVVLQIALLGLTLGTLLSMRSRGAWAGLAVATVAFLMWYGRRTRMVAAVSGAALALAMTLPSPRNVLDSQTFSKAGASLLDSVSIRVGLWSKALDGIRDSPLTGLGMNTFRKVMPVRYPLSSPPAFPNADVAHAHDNFLQAALDLGIPGLVAYVSLCIVSLVLLVMVYRHSEDRVYRVMAGGLGAGLIAYFVFGITDAIPLGSKLGVLFWLTLAVTVALHRVALMGEWSHEAAGRDGVSVQAAVQSRSAL
ncbi:MAG: O-antigen ligase family protein [Acidobacteria bacterium]|nr:O-antigen ligase family protein [Acidobacteriota bacterium]